MKNNEYFEAWYEYMLVAEGGGLKGLNKVVKLEGEPFFTNLGIIEPTFNFVAPRVMGISDPNELYRAFRNMTPTQHKYVAKWFWFESGAYLIDDGRVAAFFIEAMWGGGYEALRHYQRWLNSTYKPNPLLYVDGLIRSKSADVINAVRNQTALFDGLIQAMADRYPTLKNANLYLRGWLNRLNKFNAQFRNKKKVSALPLCRRCLSELELAEPLTGLGNIANKSSQNLKNTFKWQSKKGKKIRF